MQVPHDFLHHQWSRTLGRTDQLCCCKFESASIDQLIIQIQ